MTYDIIKHHGILGQKWGVRRYQNEDGSLTRAGKQRYGVGSSQGKMSGDSSTKKSTITYLKPGFDLKSSITRPSIDGFISGGSSYRSPGKTMTESQVFNKLRNDYYFSMQNQFSGASDRTKQNMIDDLFYSLDRRSGGTKPNASDATQVNKLMYDVAYDKALKDIRSVEDEIFEEEKKELDKIVKELGMEKYVTPSLFSAVDGSGNRWMAYRVVSPFDGSVTSWKTDDISKMAEYLDKEFEKKRDKENRYSVNVAENKSLARAINQYKIQKEKDEKQKKLAEAVSKRQSENKRKQDIMEKGRYNR